MEINEASKFNAIRQYILEHGEFPFHFFGVEKSSVNIYTSEYQEKYRIHLEGEETYYEIIYYLEPPGINIGIDFCELIRSKHEIYPFISKLHYSSSNFSISSKGIIEQEILLGKGLNNELNVEQEIEAFKKGTKPIVGYSKKIVRAKENPKRVDIEYIYNYYSEQRYGYKSIDIEDDKSLNGSLSFDEEGVIHNIRTYQTRKSNRIILREKLLIVNDYDEIPKRNQKFMRFVLNGITLEETLGIVSNFVTNLPYSIDPLNAKFMPGEAFFREPIDLHQLNHKSYNYPSTKTIYSGMKKWGDTRKTAGAIALCVFFQNMLMTERTDFSHSEIWDLLNRKGVLETNDYNLLLEISEKMVEYANLINRSSMLNREKYLMGIFAYIQKAASNYGFDIDLKTYYHAQNPPGRIKPISIKPIDEPKLLEAKINSWIKLLSDSPSGKVPPTNKKL